MYRIKEKNRRIPEDHACYAAWRMFHGIFLFLSAILYFP